MAFSNNQSNRVDELKNTILDLKAKAEKSKIQEEYLLKTLQKEFEIETFEEALELLEVLIEEKNELDKQIENNIDEIIQKMQKENLL